MTCHTPSVASPPVGIGWNPWRTLREQGDLEFVLGSLSDRLGGAIYVPVADEGWAAIVIDMAIPNSDWNPHQKTIRMHFVQYIAHNVDSTPGLSGFGVKVIALTQ